MAVRERASRLPVSSRSIAQKECLLTFMCCTVQALASEIQLDVYCININSNNMTDSLLAASLRSVPSRSIVVIEDIDATFSVEKRNLQEATGNTANAGGGPPQMMGRGTMLPGMRGGMGRRALPPAGPAPYAALSLSGLLNAIDGVEVR